MPIRWWVGCRVRIEGALRQRDKQKPGKGRQQTELGSKPGMGDGRVCKAAWETSKCRVTRTWFIKKKTKCNNENFLKRESGVKNKIKKINNLKKKKGG